MLSSADSLVYVSSIKFLMQSIMRHRSYTRQNSSSPPGPSSGSVVNNTTNTSSNNNNNNNKQLDDADAAAGLLSATSTTQTTTTTSLSSSSTMTSPMLQQPPIPPSSIPIIPAPKSINSVRSDLEFFDDLVSEPVLVLGVDISHLTRQTQFLVCASGVFLFSLLYGFLQELISVQLCHRQLGLFLAVTQFTGYTLWSFLLRTYVYERHERRNAPTSLQQQQQQQQQQRNRASSSSLSFSLPHHGHKSSSMTVPFSMYLGLSLLRAIDLGMTNMAMQYINYPAKTLMKSSRVVFTMLFGVLVARKRYQCLDYVVVCFMVTGLGIFMHADANSSAVFDVIGIVMLTISLLCDGAISNMSEAIMNQFGVGQDEFIFRMYSIALVAITGAAVVKGDMYEGMVFLSQPGRYDELHLPLSERTWSVPAKLLVMALFSTMGFFGSSCSAAITKNFGALTMSITSTARKATTLFLSFAIFDNECTVEHVGGIVLFVSALVLKSMKRGMCRRGKHTRRRITSKSTMTSSRESSQVELMGMESSSLLNGDSKHVHVV